MPKRNIIWILVAGVVALLLWKVPEGAVRRDALYTQFSPLLDVRVQVLKHYVEPVADEQLLKGAIDGMLNHLDPYCAYFSQREYEQFNKQAKGQFYGIGIEVTRLPSEGLLIVSPIEGSPAFHAGLRAGDHITAIDGVKTDHMPLDKGVEMISGSPGTSVRLTVMRPSTEETFDKTITRGLITVRTVRGWARDGDWQWDYLIDPERRIGYVRISRFEGQTAEQFDEVVRDLLARHRTRGLVLD
ncbi:MAG: PDZ domain-containing protein, partial [Planctomycetes bacterium]|nr:PDZ domain-containing protein [Planctomycetota bacterium]